MGNIVEREAGSPSTSQTPRSGPLKILKPEEEYKIHHITRMGNDAMVRPVRAKRASRLHYPLSSFVTLSLHRLLKNGASPSFVSNMTSPWK